MRLSLSAFGQWQIAVSPKLFGYLLLASELDRRKGPFFVYDLNVNNSQNEGRARRSVDPNGMDWLDDISETIRSGTGWGTIRPNPNPPIRLGPKNNPNMSDYRRSNAGCCNLSGVSIICRTMGDAYHIRAMTHCYMVFADKEGNWVETISGRQSGGFPNYLEFADSDWDLNYAKGTFINDGDDNVTQNEYPFMYPLGKSWCDLYECMYAFAQSYSGTTIYSQTYHNSNTLLTNAMSNCGVAFNFPASAFGGSDTGSWILRSCVGKCTGGDVHLSDYCTSKCIELFEGRPVPYHPRENIGGPGAMSGNP